MRVFRRAGRVWGWGLLLSLGCGGFGVGCASRFPGPGVAVYPEDSDPAATIAEACRRAGPAGRRVLLNFGANWCSDSRALHHRFTTDERLAGLLRDRYELVMIDVGRRDGPLWDAEVVQRYGRPFAGRGIPALVVLDADGRQLTTVGNNPLRDTAYRHPRRVRRFLETWAAP